LHTASKPTPRMTSSLPASADIVSCLRSWGPMTLAENSVLGIGAVSNIHLHLHGVETGPKGTDLSLGCSRRRDIERSSTQSHSQCSVLKMSGVKLALGGLDGKGSVRDGEMVGHVGFAAGVEADS
jgi:hypothetical protein